MGGQRLSTITLKSLQQGRPPAEDLAAQLGRLAEVTRLLTSADVVVLAECRWDMRGFAQLGKSACVALPQCRAMAEEIDFDGLTHLLTERGRRPQAGGELSASQLGLLTHRCPEWAASRGAIVAVEEAMPSTVFLLIGANLRADRLPDAMVEAARNAIALHRYAQVWKESANTTRDEANNWMWLLSLVADAVWDADETGQIASVRPLGDRLPSPAVQAMLRHNALHIDGHGPLTGVFSDVNEASRLQGHIHTGDQKLACRVSAKRTNGRIRGLVTVVDGADAIRQRHNLLNIIQRLNRVRERERDLRLEAETLLQGLRILTAGSPSHKVLEELFQLLRGPLGFEAAWVVRRNRVGKLEWVAGGDEAPPACDLTPLAPWLEASEDAPVLLDCDDPANACLAAHWRSIMIARLEVDLDAAWLICVHSLPDVFRPQKVGLLSRLVLLAKQALTADEQRRLMIHSSKLASLGEMVTSLAHEINQPLGTIALAVKNLKSLLSKPDLDRGQLVAKVDRIARQLQRVEANTTRMRDFARKGERRSSAFPLHRHVVGAVDLVEGRLRRHGIEVNYIGADEGLLVVGDPEQFEQVMVNLLANASDSVAAMRAAATGEELMQAPTITVAYRKADYGMTEAVIRDCGTGFDSVALAHAMDPFFTTKDRGSGTGIGLTVSNTMIRDMEGWIRLANWDGGGEVTVALKSAG